MEQLGRRMERLGNYRGIEIWMDPYRYSDHVYATSYGRNIESFRRYSEGEGNPHVKGLILEHMALVQVGPDMATSDIHKEIDQYIGNILSVIRR